MTRCAGLVLILCVSLSGCHSASSCCGHNNPPGPLVPTPQPLRPGQPLPPGPAFPPGTGPAPVFPPRSNSGDILTPQPLPQGGVYAPGGQGSSSAFGSEPPLPTTPPPPVFPQIPSTSAMPDVRLGTPELLPPTARDDAPSPTTPSTPQRPAPSPKIDRPSIPSLPLGISQFVEVKPGIASGRRPILDGFDWLAANGYKTVLFVRDPSDHDEPDRANATKAGLVYLSLEVSPKTLNLDTLRRFNEIVADTSKRPLFVYDRTGHLAGGMWYLHLRKVERLDDTAARRRADQLGYRLTNPSEEQRTFEIAIQRLLSELENPLPAPAPKPTPAPNPTPTPAPNPTPAPESTPTPELMPKPAPESTPAHTDNN